MNKYSFGEEWVVLAVDVYEGDEGLKEVLVELGEAHAEFEDHWEGFVVFQGELGLAGEVF